MNFLFQQLDLYQDDDYQNLMMDCYQENIPIILQDNRQEKIKILKEIKEFLLYEDYLLKCFLKSNMSSIEHFDSYIQIYKFDSQQKKFLPHKNQELSMKKYFTIGNNTSLINNELEINEIVFNDVQIELMHLEVNYEDLLLPNKNKNNIMQNLNEKMANTNISSKIKENIVTQLIAKDDDQLKIKNLKKQSQQYPLIDVNSYFEYSILKQNEKYKLGGGDYNRNILKILEIKLNLISISIEDNIQYQRLGINYDIEYLNNHSEEQEIYEILQSPAIKLINESDGQQYILVAYQRTEFSIGRSSSNDIQINHQNISRNHCLIRYLENQQHSREWEIMDLQSAQGTWYLMQDNLYYKIDNMTRIKVGSNILKFELLKKDGTAEERWNDEFQQEEDLTECLMQL